MVSEYYHLDLIVVLLPHPYTAEETKRNGGERSTPPRSVGTSLEDGVQRFSLDVSFDYDAHALGKSRKGDQCIQQS